MKATILFILMFCTKGRSEVNPVYRTLNDIAITLFNEYIKRPNMTHQISPVAFVTGLTAVLVGSREDTADELNRVMGFQKHGIPLQDVLRDMQSLISQITKFDGIKIENELILPQTSNPLPIFKSTIRNQLFTTITLGQDLQGEIVPYNSFKIDGVWKYPFQRSGTILSVKGFFNYGYDFVLNSELVEVPYENSDFTWVIIQPKKDVYGNTFHKNLNVQNLMVALDNIRPTAIHLVLKEINHGVGFNNKGLLHRFGVKKAFTPGLANFVGIDGTFNLKLLLQHQDFMFKVSDKGNNPAPALENESEIINIEVKRPIAYLVRHVPTNTILFMGQLHYH